jgi:hypothetical protein
MLRFGVKNFFVVTAVIEASTGVALAVASAKATAFLFGSPLSTDVGTVIGSVTAAALFALGTACWLARNDEKSDAAFGLIVAMLIYNVAATAMLGYFGLVSDHVGIGLWPAVLLHSGLAGWCIVCVRRRA